jgi:DNA-directed RNA polymerase specialized sigma24 family protein
MPPSEPAIESDVERGLVDRLCRAGSGGHPSVSLDRAEFSHGAHERAEWTAEDDGGSRLDALAAMDRRGRGPDVYLVVACDARREGAWDRLCATSLAAVARALTAQGVPLAEADVIARDLPGHLIQPPRHGRSRTRLGGYRGVSSLTTFLATAALALRTSEQRVRRLASLNDRPPGMDPEVISDAPPIPSRLEDAEAAAQLKATLPAAWARLTRQESLALLFQCRDALPQKTIATLLGVGAPRVSRILDRAHARLRAALVPDAAGAAGLAQTSRTALRDVLERFLATSFLHLRPGAAQGPHGASTDETR